MTSSLFSIVAPRPVRMLTLRWSIDGNLASYALNIDRDCIAKGHGIVLAHMPKMIESLDQVIQQEHREQLAILRAIPCVADDSVAEKVQLRGGVTFSHDELTGFFKQVASVIQSYIEGLNTSSTTLHFVCP